MEGQDICTVIIKDTYNDNNLTTVSFRDFDSAVDYAMEELADLLQLEDNYDEVKEELEENLFYKTHDYTVWIDSTKLF